MKKRTESNLVTAILSYLQCLENSRRIKHCDRLNSGRIFTGKRLIRLCRPGTPDIYVITKNGIIFLEAKAEKGKQTLDQLRFEQMVADMPYIQYHIVKSVDEVDNIFNRR